MSNKNLSEKIKRIRQNLGLSGRDFAAKLGVSKASVSMWESGKTSPKMSQIPKIAELANISIDELLGYEEQESYYEDPEVAALAEELRTNPDLKILFSASKDITVEQMKKTVEYIKFLKSQEHNENNFLDE